MPATNEEVRVLTNAKDTPLLNLSVNDGAAATLVSAAGSGSERNINTSVAGPASDDNKMPALSSSQRNNNNNNNNNRCDSPGLLGSSGRRFRYPRPFSGSRNGAHSKSQKGLNSYWYVPPEDRSIGVGTVGLFEGDNNNHNNTNTNNLPAGATACINGQVIIGSPLQVRRMREYEEWREKHNKLFTTLREQNPRSRSESRRRHERAVQQRREAAEKEYAAAVTRLRHRGWSIVGISPASPNNNSNNNNSNNNNAKPPPLPSHILEARRKEEIKAQREESKAACEAVVIRRLEEAARRRDSSARQLAQSKEAQFKKTVAAREAAATAKEERNIRIAGQAAQAKEKVATTRAEREAMREYAKMCAAAEERYRRIHLATLRERVLTKTTSQSPSNSPNSTRNTDLHNNTINSDNTNTNNTNPLVMTTTTTISGGNLTSTFASTFSGSRRKDWRQTFKSPLRRLPNASDDEYRRQWQAELTADRMALARAEVERVKKAEQAVANARYSAYKENCEKAEQLRSEREALRVRKQQQEETLAKMNQAIRRQEEACRKRKENMLQNIIEEKRQRAMDQRRAIEEEEQWAHTMEEEELQRLRERAAMTKSPTSRSARSAPSSPMPPSSPEATYSPSSPLKQ